ncbi:hypothetical protein LTR95_012075, partial [Oleoguttula sp. CCFEE 5521]
CIAYSTATAKHDDDFGPTPPRTRTPMPSLYRQRYSEQTFIGTHNAPAIRTAENNWSLSGNQYFNISVQLDAGIRLLQAQGHRPNTSSDEIRLCHFNCALMDGGNLNDYLLTVKDFLEANPREVVTLLFVNAGVNLRYWMRAYRNTGLDLMSYTPPRHLRYGNMRISDWPTIAQMVATNQRLVTFMSSGADEYIAPYLLLEWRYLFETNFGIEAPNQYDCRPARPRWEPPWYVPDRLTLVNHFLYAKFLGFRYPNDTYASMTNAAGFHVGELGEHAVRCRELYGRRPNFLLVDFFNEGDVFAVERGMNMY